MIRKILIASTALAAIAAFTAVIEPVHAGSSCVLLAAKGRGIDEANASNRIAEAFDKQNQSLRA